MTVSDGNEGFGEPYVPDDCAPMRGIAWGCLGSVLVVIVIVVLVMAAQILL